MLSWYIWQHLIPRIQENLTPIQSTHQEVEVEGKYLDEEDEEAETETVHNIASENVRL